jgi:hypothetical protein
MECLVIILIMNSTKLQLKITLRIRLNQLYSTLHLQRNIIENTKPQIMPDQVIPLAQRINYLVKKIAVNQLLII